MNRRCFVAGSPISHSRSPMIHGFWMREHGLDAGYERVEARTDGLPSLLAGVRDGRWLGGNLTVPLKEAVIPHLDAMTPEAGAMGAVNTLFMRDGRLTGANTDVDGFFAHLAQARPGWTVQGATVLVLGAGGAARAIIHGLLARGAAHVMIANRTRERARALITAQEGSAAARLRALAWPPAEADMAAASLIINATSLGMKGQPPLELAWPQRLDGVIACDIVYAPLVTPFLADAAARGAATVDGLGMLLHQAALAFSHWFDLVPTVSPALRALIEADLTAPDGAKGGSR